MYLKVFPYMTLVNFGAPPSYLSLKKNTPPPEVAEVTNISFAIDLICFALFFSEIWIWQKNYPKKLFPAIESEFFK